MTVSALLARDERRNGRLRADRRRLAFDVQHRTCWLCGSAARPMQVSDHTAPDYATFDEVTPRSAGGRPEPSNRALAHADCNMARGSRPATAKQLARLRAWRVASC